MNNVQNENETLINMKPEDYLEKQNIRKDLADAINLVLENRPDNPLHFIYDYFNNHLDNSNSNIMKAYNILTMNKYPTMNSLHIFEAFSLLEKGQDNKIIQMLLIDYPKSVFQSMLKMLDKNDEGTIEFSQFEAIIRTINMFQVQFDEMDELFRHLDYQNTNKVRKEELKKALEILPNFKELDVDNKECDQEDPDSFTYEEFLNLLLANMQSSGDSDSDEED